MSKTGRKGPKVSAEGGLDKAARQARQAQALRENLGKRKSQTRNRAVEAQGGTDVPESGPNGPRVAKP